MYIKVYKNQHWYGGIDLLPMVRVSNKYIVGGIVGGILGVCIALHRGKPLFTQKKGTLTWIIK